MPLTLPHLYTSPNDVYDQIGIDAAQLRLDDRNLATGQKVELVTLANAGDASLSIIALQYPILVGTHLIFDQAGIDVPVEVTTSAPAPFGSLLLSVLALGTGLPAGAQATDNGVNLWLAGLLAKACRYATGRVKDYCCSRYDDSDLYQNATENGCVNRWATALAVRWLSKRLYRSAPQSAEEDYKEAIDELKAVRSEGYAIADIPTRTSAFPFISNVSLVDAYTVRKVRVETQISEQTPTQFPQSVDWSSILLYEF